MRSPIEKDHVSLTRLCPAGVHTVLGGVEKQKITAQFLPLWIETVLGMQIDNPRHRALVD